MSSVRYALVNDRLGGTLDAQLKLWRAAGVSYQAMSRIINLETGVPVSRESVRQWVLALDEPNGEAA